MNAWMRNTWVMVSLSFSVMASAQEVTEDAVEALPPVVSEAEAIAPLEAAYQKEMAYLTAERDALSVRIQAQASERTRVLGAAKTEVTRLEARLEALRVRSENAETLLEDVERAAEEALAADDLVDAAWFQARNSLESEGERLTATPDDPKLADIATGFSEALAVGARLIREGGQIRVVNDSWFASDGAETAGEVVRVGNVASFGRTDAETAALVPQGLGRFQVWRDGGGATGADLLSGAVKPTMGLFLHEGRAKRVDERPPKTMGDILEAGGTVGYVILALGVLAVVLMAARAATLMRASRGAASVAAVVAALEGGERTKATSTATTGGGSAGRVMAALVPHLDRPRGELEDVASEAILRETPLIERFGAAILVVAAVAPLLGLLGTVTGMIATFDIITEFGTGDPRMLSGGISAALVTTQFGLIVAIPALLGGNLLTGWGEVVMGRTEGAALAVLNAIAPAVAEPVGGIPSADWRQSPGAEVPEELPGAEA
ncbi:MAG: MotA/TolQ/ExbB proton channel family protein [Myxococcota bacterium]